jgi:hypothetical protein
VVVKLRWRLGFGFEAKLAWRGVGEAYPSLYRGWEESGRIKIRIRDKIQVLLKNEIPQNLEIRVRFR